MKHQKQRRKTEEGNTNALINVKEKEIENRHVNYGRAYQTGGGNVAWRWKRRKNKKVRGGRWWGGITRCFKHFKHTIKSVPQHFETSKIL